MIAEDREWDREFEGHMEITRESGKGIESK